nr:MAG TPA: hypothetical protein [Caudoviricetes sp.]
MMIVHSDVADPSRVMTVRGSEASEGSTPSMTFRAGIGLLMIHFLFHAIDPSR